MQEGGDIGIYVYVELNHFVIKQKLTHHCKSIILQKRCLKKRKKIKLPYGGGVGCVWVNYSLGLTCTFYYI